MQTALATRPARTPAQIETDSRIVRALAAAHNLARRGSPAQALAAYRRACDLQRSADGWHLTDTVA